MTLNALEVVARSIARPVIRSAVPAAPLSTDDWIGMMSIDAVPYLSTTLRLDQETIDGSFAGLVQGAYRSNGIIFACLMTRFLLFSEARFAFQQMRKARPGNLFGTPELAVLETPEPGRTTGDLLARMLLDADLAGIWFGVRQAGPTVKRLRPDWTAAVFGSKRKDAVPSDPDSELVGFSYMPGGPLGKAETMSFLPAEVAHFSPIPDGLRNYVGMSWLTPILRELQADTAATIHKLAYFRNAATPNLMITLPPALPKVKAEEWIELFEQEHRGAFNAYKSIYFGGGAKAEAIGANLGQLDYRDIRAADETRIAAAAGIHPVILGLTEGLQGSALNAGNFAAAARLVADKTMRPLWRNASGSLQSIITVPNGGSRLWYDDRDVPFLRDDIKDAAEVVKSQASSIGGLIKDGFEPEAAVDSVTSNDLTRLAGQHTGLVSVQLQPPGTIIPSRRSTDGPAGQAAAGAAAEGAEPPRVAISPLRAALEQLVLNSGRVRATGNFWPVSGSFETVGEIPKGFELEASHPIVREFPGMFAPVAELLTSAAGVHCPKCGKKVAVRLAPGSLVVCRFCKTEVAA